MATTTSIVFRVVVPRPPRCQKKRAMKKWAKRAMKDWLISPATPDEEAEHELWHREMERNKLQEAKTP